MAASSIPLQVTNLAPNDELFKDLFILKKRFIFIERTDLQKREKDLPSVDLFLEW